MAKKFQELEIRDNFMFCAVMSEPENCKELLETILEIPIERVEVDKEKSLVYHPEYKGVRLDVYANDAANTHYNVEMQAEQTPVEKRSRYYHSMIDTDLLLAAANYEDLPDSYVIFICDYMLFHKSRFGNKYKYTLRNRCDEYPEMPYDDGSRTIILGTSGDNPEDISPKLLEFLHYVKDQTTVKDSKTGYSVRLDECIKRIKQNREMRSKYMLYEEIIRKEHREANLSQLVKLVCRNLARGKSPEEITEWLEADDNTLIPILEAAKAFAPDYPAEKVLQALKQQREG